MALFHPNHQRSRFTAVTKKNRYYTIACCFFRDPRSVIGAVHCLREIRRATRYCVYGNSVCRLCITGENNAMTSSLSVIIITTIVKLCNLFDSVRAWKLVPLPLFFSFPLVLSFLLAFILPPSFFLSPPLCPFSSFLPQLFDDEYCVDPREEQTTERRERKTSILKVTDICLPSENPASSPVLNRPNTLIGH